MMSSGRSKSDGDVIKGEAADPPPFQPRADPGLSLSQPATGYPPFRAALWPITLLFFAANLYNIDRLIVGVLAEQIRAGIHISDVQMSLLIGPAYGLLSGLFGVVLGFYIDRANRVRFVAFSLALWSLATIGGGLSASFGWLFLARAMVGLGEAALAPAALALIADLFPPGQRGRAVGVYSLGAIVGSALSAVIPGLIVGAKLHLALPGQGALAPWRTAFVLCGAAGLLVALLMLTVSEPVRRGVAKSLVSRASTELFEKVGYLRQHASVFLPFFLGFGFFYLAVVAITAWTTVMLSREFGIPLNRFSSTLGLVLLIAGLSGYSLGGILMDARALKRSADKLRFMVIAPALALPSCFAVFAPGVVSALILLSAITIIAPIITVANSVLVQEMLPNNMRGFGLSLTSVGAVVLGVACGPPLVALATQHLFQRPEMVGYSMLLVSLPALLASMVCYMCALRGLRQHLARSGPLGDIVRAGSAN